MSVVRCSAGFRFLSAFVLLLILGCLSSPGTDQRVSAQRGESWSTPVNLSESDTASYYPDVAVDSAGHVYVVWGEFSLQHEGGGQPDLLMLRVWDGKTWSPANDIALGGHLPQIGVDSLGRLHLTGVGSYSRAWAQENPSDAKSWSTGQGWALRAPYWPDMVVDSQDRIHIVFTDTREYDEERVIGRNGLCLSGCRGTFYVRSTDGGGSWSEPIQLDTPDVDAETPRLAVDTLGNVYVVWVDTDSSGTPLDIGFSISTNAGESWSMPAQVAAGDDHGYNWPQVAVDSMGTIHVVWRYLKHLSTGGVGYVRSADRGESWSPVEILPVISGSAYSFGLAADSADNLHMVIPLGAMGVYHLVRPPGGPWSSPTPISQNPCNAGSADAELVISQGNHLHAVWYDRLECKLGFVGPSGRGEVFYSSFVADAPHIAPRPLPAAPTATPTPAPARIRAAAQSTIIPSPKPTAWEQSGAYPGSGPGAPNSSYPLVVGIGLSLSFLIAVVVVHRARLGRR